MIDGPRHTRSGLLRAHGPYTDDALSSSTGVTTFIQRHTGRSDVITGTGPIANADTERYVRAYREFARTSAAPAARNQVCAGSDHGQDRSSSLRCGRSVLTVGPHPALPTRRPRKTKTPPRTGLDRTPPLQG